MQTANTLLCDKKFAMTHSKNDEWEGRVPARPPTAGDTLRDREDTVVQERDPP